jgi:hypothetical protein
MEKKFFVLILLTLIAYFVLVQNGIEKIKEFFGVGTTVTGDNGSRTTDIGSDVNPDETYGEWEKKQTESKVTHDNTVDTNNFNMDMGTELQKRLETLEGNRHG